MVAGIDWLLCSIASCPAIPIRSLDELYFVCASCTIFIRDGLKTTQPGLLCGRRCLPRICVPELDCHGHGIQIGRIERRKVMRLYLQHHIKTLDLDDSGGAHGNGCKAAGV